MKLFFVVVIITLVNVSTVFMKTTTSADVLDPKDVEPLMKVINEARRNFAKRFNVANMHELEHDETLTAYALLLFKKCPKKKELYENEKHQVIPVLTTEQIYLKSSELKIELGRLTEQHLTNPIQTRIGAGYLPKHCPDYNLIAVMGPSAKYVVKSGTPGSACGDRSNVDGLCVKKSNYRKFSRI